jgi:hypothetical protein
MFIILKIVKLCTLNVCSLLNFEIYSHPSYPQDIGSRFGILCRTTKPTDAQILYIIGVVLELVYVLLCALNHF